MYILVDTNKHTHFIEGEDELMRQLKILCFAWVSDSMYHGTYNYEELFNYCCDKHDFGDIAMVFECDHSRFACILIQSGESLKLTRIY